jgi:hypothetical protein
MRDETPEDGPAPTLAGQLARWFLAAGVFLMLPRQWIAGGTAIGVGATLMLIDYLKSRKQLTLLDDARGRGPTNHTQHKSDGEALR